MCSIRMRYIIVGFCQICFFPRIGIILENSKGVLFSKRNTDREFSLRNSLFSHFLISSVRFVKDDIFLENSIVTLKLLSVKKYCLGINPFLVTYLFL